MRYVKWYSPILLLLLLASCGSPQPPATELERLASGVDVTIDDPGFAFLPPIGRPVDGGDFFPNAQLSIEVIALDGTRAGESLHTVSVRDRPRFYQAQWRVADTIRASSNVTQVEVRVFRTDLPVRQQLGSFEAMVRAPRTRHSAAPGVLDVTRTQTVPIEMHFALVGAGVVPETLDGLTPLVIDSFVEDEDGSPLLNCIVNEFTMPTQGFNAVGAGFNAVGAGFNAVGAGFNAVGAVGGLFLFEQSSTVSDSPEVRLFDPGEAYALIAGLVVPEVQYKGYRPDVAILVVDDFSTSTGLAYEVPGDLLEPSASREVLTRIALDELSHGALVMHQIVQMLEDDTGWERTPTSNDWGPGFVVFEDDFGQRLVVAGVDTGGFETDVIPERINNALNALLEISYAEDTFTIDRVAVNMSFAIVPCGVLDDYQAFVAGLPKSFEEYVEALGDANGLRGLEEDLANLVLTPLAGENEPLFTYITDPYGCYGEGWGGEGSYTWEGLVASPPYYAPCWWGEESNRYVNYFASSGNFGLDYPMFPAAWPSVVGVGSQNATFPAPEDPELFNFDPPTKSLFSNRAEIMAPGALFELGSSGSQALGYAGTSFSAPVVTLYAALDFLRGSPWCGNSDTSLLADASHPSQPANGDLPFDEDLITGRCGLD